MGGVVIKPNDAYSDDQSLKKAKEMGLSRLTEVTSHSNERLQRKTTFHGNMAVSVDSEQK